MAFHGVTMFRVVKRDQDPLQGGAGALIAALPPSGRSWPVRDIKEDSNPQYLAGTLVFKSLYIYS